MLNFSISSSFHINKVSRIVSLRSIRCLTSTASASSYSTPSSTIPPDTYHVPVMKKECLEHLKVAPNKVFVDCTLGGGGHTEAMLELGASVISFDQDPDAIKEASERLQSYLSKGKLEIFQTNFANIYDVLKNKSKLAKDGKVDGVLMDLGVSSHQLDERNRGFSFSASGPLDMRMNQGILKDFDGRLDLINPNLTAEEIVNNWDADQIADILYYYGDEVKSRQITREIISSRPLKTTKDLEEAITRSVPQVLRTKCLSRCFQALRIAVNNEMLVLEIALNSMKNCIKEDGILAILSYHSLEDRRVKLLFKDGKIKINNEEVFEKLKKLNIFSEFDLNSDYNPWEATPKRSIKPTEEEIEINRRSRSAKLRVARRLPPPSEVPLDSFQKYLLKKKKENK